MQIKQRQDIWKAGIVFGIALFILNSAIFVWLGRVNADEGWYLYASKLVYAGYLPYKDFAFTQTPLLPYIYGIPQLFFQSLYLGRITSVVFSTATFLLSLRIAENYGGKMATAIAALLGATFSNGIYAQATTTTFALTSFFLMAAFFVLSSNLRQNHKAVLAVVFVIMATLSRLSAAFFAIPFVVYAFMIADKKGRLIILGLCLATLAGMLLLISANIDGAIWGLVGYHTGQWGDKSLLERAATIAGLRIPALLLGYSYYFLLWATVFFLWLSRIRARIK